MHSSVPGAFRASLVSVALAAFIAATPVAAATFTVNSTGDAVDAAIDGVCDTGATISGGAAECTLRAALQEANATAAADTIAFGIPASDANCTLAGVCTIEVLNAAPSNVLEASAPVTIDGSTQPGNAAVCTTALPLRPTYRIVLDGASAEPGLRLATGSSGSTIRGLNLRNFLNTIAIVGSSGNTVACNFIGTDASGMNATGIVNGQNGVLLGCNSQGNVIGGATAADGNLIAAHEYDGVQIVGGGCPAGEPDDNAILGNYIGVAKDGTTPLGNGFSGVSVFDGAGPDGTLIGLMPDGGGGHLYLGNVIGANASGVYLGPDVSGTIIAANAIGTSADGLTNLGNTYGGVETLGADNRIGGPSPAEGNLVSNNGDGGVMVYGADALRNRIQRNSIWANGGLGIDLAQVDFVPDGRQPNDPGDGDAGPNNLQNSPDLHSAAQAGPDLNIGYRVDSPGTLTIEFFAAQGGQGRTFLGEATYALAGGDAVATVPIGPVVPGSTLVATATDASGNTSEFSLPFAFRMTAAATPVPVVDDLASMLLLVAALGTLGAIGARASHGRRRG